MKTVYTDAFKDWGENFFKMPMAQMTAFLCEAFMICTLAESEAEFPPTPLRTSFQFLLTEKRFKAVGVEASPAVITFISTLGSTPGELVMMVMAIRWLYTVERLKMGEKFMMKHLAEAFPVGFPTQETFKNAWDNQKDAETHCNMLDLVMAEFWPSHARAIQGANQ